ncbi:hypothetical protein N658DRAFT_491217 [Parathielavia hyrcaniae]|uniref:Uncharacterized protein n=1 Tax=Parathielavia hyrcaniae TaxID=113614 RepID=A0AAN6T641_9PEZI|nr:hypothetical protein N658DRAFT_491217 [Parathielavia hyrcaniae]
MLPSSLLATAVHFVRANGRSNWVAGICARIEDLELDMGQSLFYTKALREVNGPSQPQVCIEIKAQEGSIHPIPVVILKRTSSLRFSACPVSALTLGSARRNPDISSERPAACRCWVHLDPWLARG